MSESTTDNGKTIGMVAYLTFIGWIIAFVMHSNNKTEFGAFHIRQGLGLLILYILVWVLNIILAIAGIPLLPWILLIGVIVLWVLAFVGAVQGEKKLIPGLGAQFQDWFKGLG
ncbi:MAG: hypothetical protein E2O83_06255 [Bacteroidetes bacterium]|nr:MAG: hypothetical protein E2O83_06255 [Bacteroidota bacterium]